MAILIKNETCILLLLQIQRKVKMKLWFHIEIKVAIKTIDPMICYIQADDLAGQALNSRINHITLF